MQLRRLVSKLTDWLLGLSKLDSRDWLLGLSKLTGWLLGLDNRIVEIGYLV
jgi:hypothetical protein